MTTRDFQRSFAPLEGFLDRSRTGGVRLVPGELGMVAGSCHALGALRQAGVVPAAAEEALASWQEAALGILPLNIEIEGLLTIGYHPKNTAAGNARASQAVAVSTISAIRALEDSGLSIRDRPTIWDLLQSNVRTFIEGHQRRGTVTARDTGTWWMVTSLLDLLASIRRTEAWAQDCMDNLLKLCETHRGELHAAATKTGLGAYFDQLVAREALPTKPIGASGKANPLGVFLQAMDQLRNGSTPNAIPPLSKWQGSVLEWVVHAWTQMRETGDMPPGKPFVNLDEPAEQLFPIVWRTSASQAAAPVTEAEIAKIVAMNDGQLRALLLRLFQAHPDVEPGEKANLDDEANKPNAGAEISDFNVVVQTGNGAFVAAIPIKSGVELRGKPAAKVGEEYVHQFERPVNQFNWTRVVCYPLVLSGVTLNARELERRLSHDSHRCVRFVEAAAFVRILKANGLLPT